MFGNFRREIEENSTIRANIFSRFAFLIFLTGMIFVIPFFGLASTMDPVLMPRFLIWAGLTLTLYIFFLIQLVTCPDKINKSILNRRIFLAFLGYFLFSAISITKAINITEAVHEVLKVFLCMAFLFIAVNVLDKKKYISILIKSIIISAMLLCAISIYEYIINDFVFESATMANRNLLSSAFLLMLPFCLYGILALYGFWRIVSIATIISTLFCIFSLKTRSVWIGLVAATAVTVLAAGCISKKTGILSKSRIFLLNGLSCVLFLSFITAFAFNYYQLNSDSRQDSIKQLASAESIKERALLWEKTLKLIKDNFFLGVGAGNWKIALPSYGLDNLTEQTFKTRHFQRPHNDYIWVLSEIGIFGFLLYLSLFAITIFYIFKIAIHNPDTNNKLLSIFILFGITGYMTDALFSFTKERIFHLSFLMIMTAVIISIYHQTFEKPKNVSRSLTILLTLLSIAVLVLAAVNGHTRIKAEVYTKRALAARSAQNWPMVIAEIDKGYSKFATLDNASTPLKWYRGEANFLLNNISEAHEDFKAAYKAHPYHIHVLNNLGTTYELKNEHDMAINTYKKALKMYPQFEDALINLGATYYNCGRYEEAYEILMRCKPKTESPRLENYLEAVKKELAEKEGK